MPTTDFATPDAAWADLARRIPGGFGGYYLDRGTQTVVLTRLEEADDALRALGMEGSAVRRGRWDFAQLYDWQRYLDLHVDDGIEIVMTDIDEVKNRLLFGVIDEENIALLSERLISLDVPCFLVAAEVSEPIHALPGTFRR